MRVLSLAFVAGLALAVSANPVEDASTELSLEPIEPVAALEPLSVDEVDAAEEEVDSVEEDDLVARDVEAAEEEDLEAVEKRDVEEDVEEVVEKRDVEEAVEEAVEKRDVEEDLTAVEERDVEAVEEDGEEELDFDDVPVEWAHPATELATRGFAIGARSLNETSIDLDELVKRDHKVVVKNKCKGKTIQPIYHAVDGSTKKLAKLKYGKSTSMVVPEKKHAWRMFGQTGKCSFPDGNKCLLLECSFENAKFRQCNLSRVDGFNVGMSFSFTDKKRCKGNKCLKKNCPGSQAFSNPTNGGPSLRQCNTKNVGMTVTFCG